MAVKVANRDIEKMLGYYLKGSKPDVLANTVKDLDKAKSRYVIAKAMGWEDAAWEFMERCERLRISDEEKKELQDFAKTYELPAEIHQKMIAGPDRGALQLLKDWFPKVLKVLQDHGINKFEMIERRPTNSELEMDRRNGRCWTLAYTLKFDYKGHQISFDIANHSNEGGGSYGVSGRGVIYGTQQELAHNIDVYLNVLADRTENESISYYVDSILEGDSIKETLSKGLSKIQEFDSDLVKESKGDMLSSKYVGAVTLYDKEKMKNPDFRAWSMLSFKDNGGRTTDGNSWVRGAFGNCVIDVRGHHWGAQDLYLVTKKNIDRINNCKTDEDVIAYIKKNCEKVDIRKVDYDKIFDVPVDESKERVSRYRGKIVKKVRPVNEGFKIGSYLKFQKGVPGFYVKDQNEDVYLCFEQPMDNQVGVLNSATTFKLIGYKGSKAKLVAMVNDNLNGKKSGEIYFVERADLEAKARKAMPRMNKSMSGRYAK